MRIYLLLSTLLISSCGLIQDRSSEYINTTSSTEISIPEGLSDRKIQSQYPIPIVNNKRPLALEYELPKPPNATAVLDEAPYTIDQVEDQLWLRLYLAPGKVWPLLDAFWQEYQVETIEENITSGFVVTNILSDQSSLAADSNSTFKFNDVYFQARLTQGIRRNTSEIKVRVLDSALGRIEKTWQKKPVSIERDKYLLTLMGDFITSDALQNRYSMLANSIGGESRIQLLQNSQGQAYLLMTLSFQRAWNELEKALEAAQIVVSDKDLSAKTFYVSYLNESDIGQWYSSDNQISEKKLERNFSLTFKDLENGSFQIDVKQLKENLDPKLKSDLLDLIFEHIS